MKVTTLMVGQMEVNCYLVSCEKTKESIVIDPGDDAEKIMNKLKEDRLHVSYIINTHGHADHIGGNQELKHLTGASLLIHKADAEMLIDAKQNLSVFIGDPILSDPADRILNDGDTIEVGSIKLTVLHTPGHTKGGICLLTDDTLFSGDTLFAESVGRCDFPGGSMPELIQSIHSKLMVLNDSVTVLPGHGPSTSIGKERQSNPFL